MCEKGSVRHLEHVHAVDESRSRNHALEVLGVVGENGDVAHFRPTFGADEIDSAERRASLADGGGEPGEGAGMVS